MGMGDVDLVNRDPNCINDHLKVQFEDVFAEPEGAHSIDCVWKLAHFCFTCWLNIAYKIATLCCGICIAARWGCEFAEVAFNHVWIISPLLRKCEIDCAVWKRMFKTCLSCCVEPVCEACGAVFLHFKK